jgi:hypothetical protein
MSYVLTYGPNRQRIKLGDVGVVKLAAAREKARDILAERQLGMRQASGNETYERALSAFLESAKTKNKERTVRDYTRLLTSHGRREARRYQRARYPPEARPARRSAWRAGACPRRAGDLLSFLRAPAPAR